jgi:hypothetical protein
MATSGNRAAGAEPRAACSVVSRRSAAYEVEVDAADEGDLAVGDDELLAVAVERPLAGVERNLHARPVSQRIADLPDLTASGGTAAGARLLRQQPHLDPLRRLREKVAKRLAPSSACRCAPRLERFPIAAVLYPGPAAS